MIEEQEDVDAARWFEASASQIADGMSAFLDEKSKTDHGCLPRSLVVVLYRQALQKVDAWLAGLAALRPLMEATEVSLRDYGASFQGQGEKSAVIDGALSGMGPVAAGKRRGRRPKALQEGGAKPESGEKGRSEEGTVTDTPLVTGEGGSLDSLGAE